MQLVSSETKIGNLVSFLPSAFPTLLQCLTGLVFLGFVMKLLSIPKFPFIALNQDIDMHC